MVYSTCAFTLLQATHRTATARAISILGHPAVLMPGVVPLLALHQGAPRKLALTFALAALAVAVVVGAYSIYQVRAGRWAHVDASKPQERAHLNVFLCALLLGAAGVLWATGQPALLVMGLVLSAAIALVALAARRWLKLSLHCAFAAFATALAWPALLPVSLLAALTLAVAWSRLHLQRHTRREVLGGLVLGAATGLVFNVAVR